MSIRAARPGPIAAGVLLREQVVVLAVLRRSGHCMTGAVTVFVRHAVEVPDLWTPGRRRAESEGRRGGRPHALGNLAGERCRPCLRRGREIPTLPQRIVILAMINREDEGVTSQPGYTLSKPSNCPNHRDHFSSFLRTAYRSFGAPGDGAGVEDRALQGSWNLIPRHNDIPLNNTPVRPR